MTQRTQIRIESIVQGVGFRPFVYREAAACGLTGWVLNDSQGVLIEAEGPPEQLADFLDRLQQRLPPLATITSLQQQEVSPKGDQDFTIRHSQEQSDSSAQIAPDTYVCDDCLQELFDPGDARYRYPFINCTNCGPRYSIVTGIPYDRPKTTMAVFPMCPNCQAEYDDPTSRRFHAQPNACPRCGPQLQLLNADGTPHISDTPMETAISLLQQGGILAIKGLGGYHLAVDAGNDAALAELRRRKARDEKPFALMSRNLEQVRQYAKTSPEEERLLSSTERPIVLLEQQDQHGISPLVAPRNRYFGVMLPYTPLHYLLLEQHFTALVMTSGNLTDEPIAYQNDDACERLKGIADFYLSHNREIFTRTDDSIVRVMAGQPMLLRRSRGYVPRSIALPAAQDNILALGAELKNTFCMTRQDRAFMSHHVGDLKNLDVYRSFEQGIMHLQEILSWQPHCIAHDLHPDYFSSLYALEQEVLPTVAVQHHHAHLVSCMAEHGETEPCLGMIFDGIGYGVDGHIWGGEFLLGDSQKCERLGHFAYLPMPGGDAATRQPWRMAISLLTQVYGDELPGLPLLAAIPSQDLKLLRQMIDKGINSPLTSSCG
ncbi:MAG: carbamoyltransferase HypF, partial [Desulfuromonas sp.]